MKKIMRMLNDSNIGMIKGSFISNPPFEELMILGEYSQWNEPMPPLKVVLESDGEIVSLIEMPINEDTENKSYLFVSKKGEPPCIELWIPFGFDISIKLYFEDSDKSNGDFIATYANGYSSNAHVNKIFQKYLSVENKEELFILKEDEHQEIKLEE